MTHLLDRLTTGQPEAVRAVLELAYGRSELTPAGFDRIVATFAGEFAATLHGIADDLYWAERLRADLPVDVLSDYYGGRAAGWIGALEECERLADQREADAVAAAQLVASLIHARQAA
jgi:hypothetical protein